MRKYTRGEFLSLSALMAGAAALTKVPFRGLSAQAPRLPALAPETPDFIVVNARVLTQDATMPRAEAFAVRAGRFMAVGSTSDIRNLAARNTPVVDAARMTILPGFIDCHCHTSGVNELYEVDANLRSVKAIQDALRTKLRDTPAGFWINGYMFDDTKLSDGPLTKAHLDAVSTDHPIGVHHRGGHTSWFNSKAFELANVTAQTPDPEGGRYFKDASGNLTGRAAERAVGTLTRGGQRQRFTRSNSASAPGSACSTCRSCSPRRD